MKLFLSRSLFIATVALTIGAIWVPEFRWRMAMSALLAAIFAIYFDGETKAGDR